MLQTVLIQQVARQSAFIFRAEGSRPAAIDLCADHARVDIGFHVFCQRIKINGNTLHSGKQLGGAAPQLGDFRPCQELKEQLACFRVFCRCGNGQTKVGELEQLCLRRIVRNRKRHHAEVDGRIDLLNGLERPQALHHHGGLAVCNHCAGCVVVRVKCCLGVAVFVNVLHQLKGCAPSAAGRKGLCSGASGVVPVNVLPVDRRSSCDQRNRLDCPGILEPQRKRCHTVRFQGFNRCFEFRHGRRHGDIVFCKNIFIIENTLAASVNRKRPCMALRIGEGRIKARLICDVVQKRFTGEIHDIAALRDVHGVC